MELLFLDTPTLESLHPTFCSWWTAHGWQPIPLNILPRLGVVAKIDTDFTAAAWLYMDNSTPVAWLEWMVTNPAASPRHTHQALAATIDFLTQEAATLGFSAILSTARQPSLGKLLTKHGFSHTDTNVSHYLKTITHQ